MLAFETISGVSLSDTVSPKDLVLSSSTSQTIYSTGVDFCVVNQIVTIPTRTDELDLRPSIEYFDLAQTLKDMHDGEDAELSIDSAVYNTSLQVAAALFEINIPAPYVFSHGPKSVVFNWDDGVHNLYLTIGKTRLWAATSTRDKIQGQFELTAQNKNIADDFFCALSTTPLLNNDQGEKNVLQHGRGSSR